MRRRLFLLPLVFLQIIFLAGCWDYRDLDAMSIVAGIAIDKSENENFSYTVSFEVVEPASPGGESERPVLVSSEGNTVYEAVAGARKLLRDELYFGNTEVLVLCEELAKDEGAAALMEAFFRDPELRDTVIVLVSRGKTARELLMPTKSENGSAVVSYKLFESISRGKLTTHSTRSSPFYRVYNDLKRDTESLVLPAFFADESGGEAQPKAGGLAVFKEGRLRAYLEEPGVPYYLFLTETLSGGAFSFPSPEGGGKETALSIYESHPKLGFRYEDGQLTLLADIRVRAGAREISGMTSTLSKEVLKALERQAGTALKHKLLEIIEVSQKNLRTDIFGFGALIYRTDPALWEEIKPRFEELFCEAKLEVKTEFSIDGAGLVNTI